mgnify:CR=1 FL=1
MEGRNIFNKSLMRGNGTTQDNSGIQLRYLDAVQGELRRQGVGLD